MRVVCFPWAALSETGGEEDMPNFPPGLSFRWSMCCEMGCLRAPTTSCTLPTGEVTRQRTLNLMLLFSSFFLFRCPFLFVSLPLSHSLYPYLSLTFSVLPFLSLSRYFFYLSPSLRHTLSLIPFFFFFSSIHSIFQSQNNI